MLCDRLEEKMKGTVVDGTVKALFAGACLSHVAQPKSEPRLH